MRRIGGEEITRTVHELFVVPRPDRGDTDRVTSNETPSVEEASARIHRVGTVALDVETFGAGSGDALHPWRGEVRLLTLAVPGHSPWSLDLSSFGGRIPPPIAEALQESLVVAHNARFDLLWLAVRFGVRPKMTFCTLTASRLLTAGTLDRNDLDDVLLRHLKIPPARDKSRSDWGGLFLTDDQLAYAHRDVAHLHALRTVLEKALQTAGLNDVAALEMDLIPIVTAMEEAGIAMDVPKLQRLRDEALRESHAAALSLAAFLQTPSLNPSSPKQLLAALHRLGVELKDTDESTLRASGDTVFVPSILDYRSREKFSQQAQSLLEALTPDGRIHARFDPTGTDTGRFSSHSPNLQNIARGPLRSCFCAPDGHSLLTADYNQIELRAAAFLADEEKMVAAYRSGQDLHRLTAAAILGKPQEAVDKEDRQIAKSANFGLLYGQGAQGLVTYAANSYGVSLTVPEALAIRTKFFAAYPGIARWHARCWKDAHARVPEARTLLQRRRLISAGADRWQRFTALVNTPVQGSCADGLKRAMVALPALLPAGARLVSTVHDELIVECPTAQAREAAVILRQVMTESMQSLLPGIPIAVDVTTGKNWGEK